MTRDIFQDIGCDKNGWDIASVNVSVLGIALANVPGGIYPGKCPDKCPVSLTRILIEVPQTSSNFQLLNPRNQNQPNGAVITYHLHYRSFTCPCSIIPMNYYGRNDISLGEFLHRYCFRWVECHDMLEQK